MQYECLLCKKKKKLARQQLPNIVFLACLSLTRMIGCAHPLLTPNDHCSDPEVGFLFPQVIVAGGALSSQTWCAIWWIDVYQGLPRNRRNCPNKNPKAFKEFSRVPIVFGKPGIKAVSGQAAADFPVFLVDSPGMGSCCCTAIRRNVKNEYTLSDVMCIW